MHTIKRTLVNSPDLVFYQWCYEQFQINRGVYNTIEQNLFDHGYINIAERRMLLIQFLYFVKALEEDSSPSKFLKFGPGKLAQLLKQFISQIEINGSSMI